MKKWIYVILLYGTGYLIVQDVMNNTEWIRRQIMHFSERFENLYYYDYILYLLVPLLLVLINYFVLRLRAKNTAFTLLNALFIPVFIIVLVSVGFTGVEPTFEKLFETLIDSEFWQTLWEFVPAILMICGLNMVSGIVISEAKSKGTYLAAEFVYLLSGLVLGLFVIEFIM